MHWVRVDGEIELSLVYIVIDSKLPVALIEVLNNFAFPYHHSVFSFSIYFLEHLTIGVLAIFELELFTRDVVFDADSFCFITSQFVDQLVLRESANQKSGKVNDLLKVHHEFSGELTFSFFLLARSF